MRPLTKIQNRNNGRSHTYVNRGQKINVAEEKIIKHHSRDLAIFNAVTTLKVKTNSRQRIRWMFNVSKCTDEISFQQNIERVCSRFRFVGRRTITIDQKGLTRRLILDTPMFLFTLDNIASISAELFGLAKNSSAYYERWEVVPGKESMISRLKGLFR